MEAEENQNVTIRPDFALGRFRQQLQASAHGWRLQLRHIESGDFWEVGRQRVTEVPEFGLGDDRLNTDDLIQFANTEMLLGAVRSLIDYLDTIIGMNSLRGTAIQLDRDIAGMEDLQSYLNDVIAEQARSTGVNQNLRNPQKVEQIGLRDPEMKAAILSLFDLRQALEHHKRIATRRDIELKFFRLRVQIVDGEEYLGQPMELKQGQQLAVDFVLETRYFPRGSMIVLSERDIEMIVQSLAFRIGAAIISAVFPPEEPSQE